MGPCAKSWLLTSSHAVTRCGDSSRAPNKKSCSAAAAFSLSHSQASPALPRGNRTSDRSPPNSCAPIFSRTRFARRDAPISGTSVPTVIPPWLPLVPPVTVMSRCSREYHGRMNDEEGCGKFSRSSAWASRCSRLRKLCPTLERLSTAI